MFIRAYLRASTKEQDETRAEAALIEFINNQGLNIASTYRENESGRKLARPELKRLIEDSNYGDIILIESIDRLTRLNKSDWETLKEDINAKKLKIVAHDLPTSHQALLNQNNDEMTQGILDAANSMLIDILATMASKDYTMRRARAKQGMLKAKRPGRLCGRPENKKRNNGIKQMIKSGCTYSQIQAATGASRVTISKLKKEILAVISN